MICFRIRQGCAPGRTLLLATLAGAALLSGFSVAHGGEILSFVVSGKPVSFADFPEKHVTISSSCAKEGGRFFSCLAYAALARGSMRSISSKERQGGVNPGSLVCSQVGGRSITGMAPDGGENGFCTFRDGSMIDLGSLAYFARQNDKTRR